MTQPPQPGFGAPQDPQGGAQPPAQPPQPPAQPPQMPPAPPGPPPGTPPQQGYGYPQGAAPAPQGYGYPQQGQPGPYGQQPGPYGPQQSGPYGQQPGPYGQQPGPYGYPTQPQYPGAPTPPSGGGGGFFKGKTGVIVAASAAGLLLIGGGTYVAFSGDGDDKPAVSKSSEAPKPTGSATVDQGDGKGEGDSEGGAEDLNAGRKDGESKVLFLTKNDVDLPRNGSDVHGLWTVGDTVVKAMYREIAGYSVTDGSKKWSVPVDTKVCSAPVNASPDGKIVFGVEDGLSDKAKCNDLQMVDLKTGKAGWKKSIPKPDGGPFSSLADYTLAITGNTLAVGGGSNSWGFSLTDGKQLFGTPSGDCKPGAFAGGEKLIAAASCKTSDYKKPKQQLQEIDPASGKPRWTYSTPVGWEIDKVYSQSPLVVSITQNEPKKWSIISLTDKGRPRATIDGGKDKYAPRCGGSFVVWGQNLQGCTGVAADAKNFYMATETGYGTANEVVAFSLDSGKATWRSKAPAERQMTPLRMEGGEVLVYMGARYDAGGTVATIPSSGGAPKTLLQNPASTSRIESSFYSPKMAYADGRFFIASGRVSASNDKEELETKTMMAFGE